DCASTVTRGRKACGSQRSRRPGTSAPFRSSSPENGAADAPNLARRFSYRAAGCADSLRAARERRGRRFTVQGVYNNWLRFQYVRAYRALLRAMIQPLVSWRPLSKPEPGHTLAVACHDRLPEILRPNFELLCKQDLSNLRETVVSFDGPRTRKLA